MELDNDKKLSEWLSLYVNIIKRNTIGADYSES